MSKWGLGGLVSKGYVMFHVIIYGPVCLFDEMPSVANIAQDRTGPTRHERHIQCCETTLKLMI